LKLSVVILNYNVQYFLEQCVISVKRALEAVDSEIIVIDNNSSDGSCEMMERRFPEVILIKNIKNLGFSKANNQAVRTAQGEYVCILNPDTAVSENTFIHSLAHAEKIDKLGALGVYLMDGTGSFLPESKRNIPSPKTSLLKLMGFTKKSNYYANHVNEDESGAVDIQVGAFMLLKRSVYNEVGGFDEDYFMYGEDIDLSYKLLQAGYQNHYSGITEILHYKGESTLKDKAYANRFYGAMQIFYKKHFNTNLFLSLAVKLGVFAAKIVGLSDGNSNKKIVGVSQAFLLTENFGLLKQISEKIEIPIKASSKSILQDSLFENTLFIFDVDYMSYSQIFSVMKKLKNRNNQFRIRPPGCNFIIGSDRSDNQGNVMIFE
jgi:GT2 family glycosyltransferase